MKIIDRYLVKHLLLPFVFCFVSLFFIFVVIDLFDSVGDYAKAKVPVLLIVKIYVIMLGQVAPLIIPFAFFLACVYLLTNLSANKETVAMMAAGVSLARLVVPFFLIAVSLTGVVYFLYADLAPTAAVRRSKLMQNFAAKRKMPEVFTGIVYKNPATGVMWYIRQLDTVNNTLEQAEISVPNDRGADRDKYFVARGDYRDGYWDFVGVRLMAFDKVGADGRTPLTENLGQLDAKFLTESPRQISAVLLRPEAFPWSELRSFITAPYQPSAIRMAPFKTEYYRRVANPLFAPILCLFAFAFGIIHERRNRTGAIVNCLMIPVTLFLVAEICLALGNKHRISPQLAGWFPVLVYGGAALVLFVYRVGIWWEFTYVIKSTLFPKRRPPV